MSSLSRKSIILASLLIGIILVGYIYLACFTKENQTLSKEDMQNRMKGTCENYKNEAEDYIKTHDLIFIDLFYSPRVNSCVLITKFYNIDAFVPNASDYITGNNLMGGSFNIRGLNERYKVEETENDQRILELKYENFMDNLSCHKYREDLNILVKNKNKEQHILTYRAGEVFYSNKQKKCVYSTGNQNGNNYYYYTVYDAENAQKITVMDSSSGFELSEFDYEDYVGFFKTFTFASR